MVINQIMLGDTKILVDDTYLPKSEEEKQERYENFNRIACKILENKFN